MKTLGWGKSDSETLPGSQSCQVAQPRYESEHQTLQPLFIILLLYSVEALLFTPILKLISKVRHRVKKDAPEWLGSRAWFSPSLAPEADGLTFGLSNASTSAPAGDTTSASKWHLLGAPQWHDFSNHKQALPGHQEGKAPRRRKKLETALPAFPGAVPHFQCT